MTDTVALATFYMFVLMGAVAWLACLVSHWRDK